MTAERVREVGYSFDPHHLLNDPGVQSAIAVGLVAFPLFAVLGARFRALVRRRWPVLVVSVGWWLLVACPGFFVSMATTRLAVIPMALFPPIGGYASIGLTASTQRDP